MPITVNGKFYKTKKMYYIEMNPDNTHPTQNEIDRYVYHTVKHYHDYKRTFYREKYRAQKNNKVRLYIKFQSEEESEKIPK